VKEDGTVVIADEVRHPTWEGRLWRDLRRAPAAAITWLLTQTGARPVDHLEDLVRNAGFAHVIAERLPPGDFAIVQGWRR